MRIKGIINFLFFGLLFVVILTLGIIGGYNIKVWNPLSIDPIVSGVHLSSMTRDDILELNRDPAEITINLEGKTGDKETIKVSEIIANPVDDSAFQAILKNNAFKLTSSIIPVSPVFGTKVAEEASNYHYYQKGMDSTLDSLQAVSSEDIIPPTNAYGKFNPSTQKFEAVAEKAGTQLDQQLFVSGIKKHIEDNNDSNVENINLETEKLYKAPTITLGSEELNNRIAKLNKTLNTTITYKSGSSLDTLTGKDYGSWLSINENGDMIVDQNAYKSYLEKLASDEHLYTSREEALKSKRVTSGYLINYDNELKNGSEAIISNCNVTRTFEQFSIGIEEIAELYTKENSAKIEELKQKFGSEFVYVNIDQQFMWYIKDNNILVATPVVTGGKGHHDTTKGTYNLMYKATNVVLRGPGYASPVTYWMPFNGGIGIHDADGWRSSYGGDIYTYNGSHGCVNTPREKVKIIYENISPNCTVHVE